MEPLASPHAEPSASLRTIDGRYRIESEIGHGAMGTVCRAWDTTARRPVALKMLALAKVDGARLQRAQRWFRREFHVVAGLQHPRIVQVYDFGLDAGSPYYTMELLDGRDLRDVADIDLDTGVRILRDLASALAYLHARRLVHRDLKPRNVRCTSDGRAKLIDFGILAAVGTVGEIAGTPTSMAPEGVRGAPLDGRADLFGLGTLAYWMFTGRHPYEASTVDELECAWRVAPPRPRALRPAEAFELPPALEELITGLIALDPSQRPRSAAEVIDRLDAIGSLAPEPELEVARGWLNSAALVGRDDELAQLRAEVDALEHAEGGAVLIEGAAGLGRSRLLQEVAWLGQLGGALVLRTQVDAGSSEPYALVRRLVRRFVTVAPLAAERAAAEHAALVGRILPRAPGSSDAWPWTTTSGEFDAAEERLRTQRALLAYFMDIARARPLLLLVDDLHACDEASAATLAALAHACDAVPIAVVATCRSDTAAAAGDAIASFREAALVLQLRELAPDGVRALVDAVFGEIHDADRIAAWLHQRAGGHPTHTMELVRQLVDHGVIRYAEGLWVTGELVDLAPPQGMAAAMEERIEALPELARRIAEFVAVLGMRASIDAWMAAAADDDDAVDEAAVFAAVDALVYRQILVGDDAGLEPCHEEMRLALLRRLAPARRRELHARAARLLDAERPQRPELELRIGQHWLAAGERARAAALLERAGRRLYESQSFHDAIAPLEAALEVWREQPDARLRCVDLQHMLMRAGVLGDRDVLLRHADDALAEMDRDSGLALARRLMGLFGAKLALVLALAWAWLRWAFARRAREHPRVAMARMVAMTNYTASVHSLSFAKPQLRRVAALLAPLRGLHGRVPRAAYLMVENFVLIADGRWRSLDANVDEIIALARDDRRTPLPEIDRRMATGTALYMRCSVQAGNQDPGFRNSLAALAELGLQFFTVGSQLAPVLFHRLRGEDELAREHSARAEVGLVQLGNAWVFTSQLLWLTPIAYGWVGDVLGLKRTIDELERRVVHEPHFEPFLVIARAEYARARRDPSAAIELLRPLLARLGPDDLLFAAVAEGALVDALLDAARPHEAITAAQSCRTRLDVEGKRSYLVRIDTAHARALVQCDRHDEAAALLERLLGQAEGTGSPALCGAVHEALAVLAAARGDAERERRHTDQAALLYATTRNPILMARGRMRGADVAPSASRNLDDATLQLGDGERSTQ
ncbi:MAG: protein kinase [Deltaproteobacteria bacterium]|nr:protein kinase [Deltaproteobacteria bacterium]